MLTQKSFLSLSPMPPSEVVSITREPFTLLETATEKNEIEESWTCWGPPQGQGMGASWYPGLDP